MDDKSNKLLLALVLAVLFVMIISQYICPDTSSCQIRGGEAQKLEGDNPPGLILSQLDYYKDEDDNPAKFVAKFNFTEGDLKRFVDFNIKGDDVIVFLHIQKTGGTTFGRHLVRNIQLEQPCDCKPGQKKCTCHRPGKKETWLFSRFSTGWSCGLHADWTELVNCVPTVMDKKEAQKSHRVANDAIQEGRNFYYITMLRDPISRFLSEWRHVQRGATWKASLHVCDGRTPTQDELPTCYMGDDWSGCTLQEFMNCPYNLANNRQVRMLADLSLVGCYNLSIMTENKRNEILLHSAKNNLKDMAFFGLTEFQRKTQCLFERTFHLKFISPFTQFNSTRAASVELDEQTRKHIEELNFLDVQLYDYAKDLFLQRFQYMRQKKHQEEKRKRQEERRLHHEKQATHYRAQTKDTKSVTTEDYTSQVERW